MKEAKHTKGEWKIEQSRNGWDDDLSIVGGDGTFVAQVKWINDNQEANASLISAAPDLLEALQDAVSALEWCVEQGGGPACEHESGVACFCKENKAINSARSAIAKALGK